jgi:hypothetical protein
MARTFRRTNDARRIADRDATWVAEFYLRRTDLTPHPWGPHQILSLPEWRIRSDGYGSDAKKKGEPIKTHRRSVRRFVRNTLDKGLVPVVSNDKQSWYCCDGVEGIVLPIEEA